MKFIEETSEDYPFQLAMSNGKPKLKVTNLNDRINSPVTFKGEKARYIKITANPTPGIGNWSEEQLYFGLSEVRFTYKSDIEKTELTNFYNEYKDLQQVNYADRNWGELKAELENVKKSNR